MANANLLDIAKLNGNDKLVGLIEENLTAAPEVELFPFRTIKGTSYTTVTRTSYPSVGFRNANAGSTPSKSTFEKKLVEAFIFGGVIQVDKAVAMAYEDGAEAWEMIEASGVARQSLIKLGSQIWYGTSSDANGFTGIKAALPFTAGVAAGTVINATGSTASTASSVYAVKFGTQDVTLVGGNNRAVELSEFTDQQISFDSGSTWLAGRVADLTGWVGIQVGNVNCVRRIANLTEDSGKGLTDLLLADLIASFPVGYRPDAIFMSRRSRKQLQKARTVVLQGGAVGNANGGSMAVAPTPTEYEGIRIVATDSILNTDAIES